MADWLETTLERGTRLVTGHQPYRLEVIGPANGVALSVVSFDAVERMSEPYRITIELTHREDLARADYLGRDASFSINPIEGGEPRKWSGWISSFSKLKTTADFSSYRLVVEAHTAKLRLTTSTRIFQNKTGPEIIEEILRRHELRGHQFLFKLRRKSYAKHAFRMQYQQTDWDYIHLLMEKEGLYSYTVEGKHGDVQVFSDDVDGYLYEPQRTIAYRETAGLEASGREAVFGLQTHTQTVPKSFLVADYNPANAWERIKGEANIAYQDQTTYGQPYVWGAHALTWDGAKWEAQLRHEAAITWQVVYEGQSNVLELRPARILRMDHTLPDAPHGQVVIEVAHSGARDRAYANSYKAIPSDRRFRLRIDEAKWPRIAGTLSARVTSPNKYKYAYLTRDGHYTVRFDFDFDERWPKGGESVPLRLAKSFAGGLQTGAHFPLLDGTEVVIAFVNGDPDRPEIVAAHHHSVDPDLITNKDGWYSRNVIRTQSDNKLEMEDLSGKEHVKLSTEHSGKSQLTLGHMVRGNTPDGRREKRGEGFELRTSAYGAIRAGRGLFVSTDDRPNGRGKQLDMLEVMERLEDAQARIEGLAQAARVAQAEAADAKGMQRVLQSQIKDLQQAAMLLSSNASMAMVTPDAMLQSAGTNLTMVAGANAEIGALQKFTVTAGEMVSLFAQKLGMKFVANKGKVQFQAQHDDMELTSAQNMTVTSSEGHVIVQARKSVTLTDGGGGYIKLENGNVTIAAPGNVTIRMANFRWDGPDTMTGKFPAFSVCKASQAAAAAQGTNSVALA